MFRDLLVERIQAGLTNRLVRWCFYTALVLPWFASHGVLAGESTHQIQPSELVGAWQLSMMISIRTRTIGWGRRNAGTPSSARRNT